MADDALYLEQSELPLFLNHLFQLVAINKPEDPLEFAERFFMHVQSCHNVLGTEYSFIASSRHNRRSFVFCLLELFRTFPLTEEMTAVEYQQVIEMICPDFPRQLILDASYSVNSSSKVTNPSGGSNSSTSKPTLKYRHEDLRVSLYFHVIYDEWLKKVEAHFREAGSLEYLNIFRVRTYLDELRNSTQYSFEQPPLDCIDEVIGLLSNAPGTATGCDVTFDGLKKALVTHKLTAEDVLRTPKEAVPLLAAATAVAAVPEKFSDEVNVDKKPPLESPALSLHKAPAVSADEASDDEEDDD